MASSCRHRLHSLLRKKAAVLRQLQTAVCSSEEDLQLKCKCEEEAAEAEKRAEIARNLASE
jgi:hypothetical protein